MNPVLIFTNICMVFSILVYLNLSLNPFYKGIYSKQISFRFFYLCNCYAYFKSIPFLHSVFVILVHCFPPTFKSLDHGAAASNYINCM